jgi:glyoxylase-like metal-dependent hydrolase (beta-lactamase superfamily II)
MQGNSRSRLDLSAASDTMQHIQNRHEAQWPRHGRDEPYGFEDRALRVISTVLFIAILLLGGCGEVIGDESGPRLYVFDCGMLRFESIEAFSISNAETDVRDLIVPCYVVHHKEKYLLWDGGLPSKTADVDGWQGEGMLSRLDRTLAEQLPGIGLDMSSFDYAIYSHSHFDHVGVANEVVGATLIIQESEYDAVFNGASKLPGVDATLIENLERADRLVIHGDHDVFGDERVRIISTPGHTPGHQSLFVDLANTGPVILSGDLYHFAISRDQRRVPRFNYDREMTLASMDRIEELVRETGATLWIEHELALFETLNKAPAYYD